MSGPTYLLLTVDTERALNHRGEYVLAVAAYEGPGHPSRHVADLVTAELMDALRPAGAMAPTDPYGASS